MENMLKIQGVPLSELAETYGTPLYIYDQNRIEEQMETYRSCMNSDVLQTEILYASKAFCIQEMVKLVQAHGLSLDVVSGGELYTALAAGFDPADIHFHGNNKSPQEIEEALQAKVGTFIVDNVMEGEYLCAQMARFDHDVHVMIRVNPGVEAHTHEYVVTAHVDSKFGISIHEQETLAALIRRFMETEHVIFDGFHAHIGSQIFDAQAFAAEIDVMGQFMADMQERFGIVCRCLDVGGGFAVRYTEADSPIPIPEVCQTILVAHRDQLRNAAWLKERRHQEQVARCIDAVCQRLIVAAIEHDLALVAVFQLRHLLFDQRFSAAQYSQLDRRCAQLVQLFHQ